MALSNIYIVAIVLVFELSFAQTSVAILGPLLKRFQYLTPINAVRVAHGLHPVQWNNTLADYARAYAHKRSADCALQHSDYLTPGYGETIAMSEGALTPAVAVGLWTGEEPFYHYKSNTCDEGEMCGHYTQIVWKTLTSIGCASAKCQNGGTFITCNYYPPGNYEGERPY